MRVRNWMLAGIAAMAMQVTAASAAPTNESYEKRGIPGMYGMLRFFASL